MSTLATQATPPARATHEPVAPARAEPAIMHGAVTHRRRGAHGHAFTYRAFMLRMPLSRLEELPAHGVALGRRGRVSFDLADHCSADGAPMHAWVRELLRAHALPADGEIVLYAFPRMMGYAFKPVSFFACHDARGRLRAVLAEVHNTFGERHAYLLTAPSNAPIADGQTLVARKAFHVSPFCAVRGHYEFRFFFRRDRWLARIDYHARDGAGTVLETWIDGQAEPLRRDAVRRLPWRYGFFTAAVVARIHWQALRLWLKRVPWYRKPAAPASPYSLATHEPIDQPPVRRIA
jgi:DUF1365 family protein